MWYIYPRSWSLKIMGVCCSWRNFNTIGAFVSHLFGCSLTRTVHHKQNSASACCMSRRKTLLKFHCENEAEFCWIMDCINLVGLPTLKKMRLWLSLIIFRISLSSGGVCSVFISCHSHNKIYSLLASGFDKSFLFLYKKKNLLHLYWFVWHLFYCSQILLCKIVFWEHLGVVFPLRNFFFLVFWLAIL